jgi:hypothetical protein
MSSLVSLMKYLISNKTFYRDHFHLSCTTFICHCNRQSIEHFILCVFIISIKMKITHGINVQVKFLLSEFCFTFHSLKPIRPRTLNIEKTWNGLLMIAWEKDHQSDIGVSYLLKVVDLIFYDFIRKKYSDTTLDIHMIMYLFSIHFSVNRLHNPRYTSLISSATYINCWS